MINNIIDCMVKHRSIRAYTDEAVSKEELDVSANCNCRSMYFPCSDSA